MHWDDELRAALLAAVGRSDERAAGEEAQRTMLASVMAAAAEVFELTSTVISGTDLPTKFESARGHLLDIDGRFVEATSIMNGFAIRVRRESGVADLLRVDDGVVVDSHHKPIGLPEAYFARHAIELARTARAKDGG